MIMPRGYIKGSFEKGRKIMKALFLSSVFMQGKER
jgi:hypothetical protein